MKHLIRSSIGVAAVLAMSYAGTYAAAPAGFVDFGKLAPSTSGGEFVEVNIKSNLIAMVTRIAAAAEPEVAELLKGLQSVRVNVIGLDDDNRDEIESRIKSIRTQLDAEGWDRVVTVQQKNEDVGVYLKARGAEVVEGIVVTVMDGRKQAVLVNIVGDIRPDKIAVIGEQFGIDPLKKVSRKLHKKQKAEVEDEQ